MKNVGKNIALMHILYFKYNIMKSEGKLNMSQNIQKEFVES